MPEPRPIRILHVLHSFSTGGLENGIVNIINNSPHHLEHELCLLTQAGEFIQRLNRPITYHELHKRTGHDWGVIVKLRRLYHSRSIDIVHTRNWAAFDGVIAACLTPGVVLIHGEHGRDMTDPQGLLRRRNILRRLFAPRVRKFTAVSHDLECWLREIVKVPAHKIVCIPNGVDTARFKPSRNLILRRQFGIDDGEFVVGAVGRLDPVKNYDGLVAAVRTLAFGNHPVRLVIAGDGPERQKLDWLIRAWPNASKPILPGFRPDVEALYGAFDLFVLNSHAEGMSNTLLEAMSSGLPILCTAVGANTDLVEDGICGTYVKPGDIEALADGIARYLKDPHFCREHGESARRFVIDNYRLHHMLDRYFQLYHPDNKHPNGNPGLAVRPLPRSYDRGSVGHISEPRT